jgi:RHS repeat-associated protein
VKVTDQEGKVTLYEYDNEGRLISTTDGNGNKITMEYTENAGQQCASCGEGGKGVSPSAIVYPTFRKEFKYDARDRKIEEKDILGAGLENEHTTTFGYDPTGNLSWVRDKEGKLTTYEYDELNRLDKVTDPEGNVTRYAYDVRGNLRFLRDGKNQTTEFRYDRANRLVKEIRPMGQELSYQYDAAGNLIQKTDAKGQKTEYGYNEAGRLVSTSYYHIAGDPTPVKTVTFAYDNLGNLTSYDDGVTSGTYEYDDLSRKLLETVNYGPFTKTISYQYYANGAKKSFTAPDGTTYAYTYDPNNQVSSINLPGVGQITYNAYQWTRPTLMTLPGGTRKEMSYDPLMRISQLATKDPGGNPVLNYQYGYDKMDNIVNKATEHGPYTYTYDNLYRLAGAVSPALPQESYTYDRVGNRLTSSNASDWTYTANNELQSYNGVTFQYDLNGNATQKNDNGAIQNFVYNEEDRLEEVKDDTGTLIATYYYDPFGRRLWKDVGGTKTYFMYADEGLIAEFDGSGSTSKSYGYAPNSTWTTNPLFMKQDNQYYFYHNDHLGTPQKMTSASGATVWSARYKAFGEAEVDPSSTIQNNLRFPGQYYDQETGLHYNYHRHYDPRAGRYTRADPIGVRGGMNYYGYSESDPLNATDPFGLKGPLGNPPLGSQLNPMPPTPLDAPGAEEPPHGSPVRFVGTTYLELHRYMFDYYGYPGAVQLGNELNRFLVPAQKRLCRPNVVQVEWCFVIYHGIKGYGLRVPGDRRLGDPRGLQCITVEIRGERYCPPCERKQAPTANTYPMIRNEPRHYLEPRNPEDDILN